MGVPGSTDLPKALANELVEMSGLSELAQCAQQSSRKLVAILDEFTYAIEAYPDLTHKLQAAWTRGLLSNYRVINGK